MANPALQNTQTASGTSTSSVTVTKPTGLTVGDIMLAFVSFMNVGTTGETVNTPSGWTALQGINQNRIVLAVFWKIADSSDVAASNFTFSFTVSADHFIASVSRINGQASGSEIAHSEIDGEVSADATLNFSGNAVPDSPESLALICFCVGDTDSSTANTISGYALTPSQTWTEVYDLARPFGTDTLTLSLAEADLSSTAEITAYQATASRTPTRAAIGSLVVINAPANASGTHALLEPATTFFSEAAVVGGTGTHNLLEPDTTFFTETSLATSPTQWINESQESNTWINESQP